MVITIFFCNIRNIKCNVLGLKVFKNFKDEKLLKFCLDVGLDQLRR